MEVLDVVVSRKAHTTRTETSARCIETCLLTIDCWPALEATALKRPALARP